LQLTKGTLVYM